MNPPPPLKGRHMDTIKVNNQVISEAKEVLKAEFPALLERISLNLPSEANRRVGQAIAAASLSVIE